MRASGILLHVTCLPGSPGIGDLGPAAIRFLDSLQRAGQSVWQVLPLNPTGYGDSPYQSPSTFAGNPLLVSPERLAEDGLLEDPDPPPAGDPARVDFGAVIPWKWQLLREAFGNFRLGKGPAELAWELDVFRERERRWLPDWVLFDAIHAEQNRAWTEWPEELRRRDPAALRDAQDRLADEIGLREFAQFLFFRQWTAVREAAAERGIRILGDAPLFVAHDSVDLWANRELFLVDDAGAPLEVAGAPPDAFTDDGQLWGNPLYRWDVLEKRGFDWWVERVRRLRELYDVLRLDHFRGIRATWSVPAGDDTARRGQWKRVPGEKLLATLKRELGDLPLVAEDLGDISEDVYELRDEFGLPGMAVLVFAFGGDPRENVHAPHNVGRNMIVYPGTHDTETVRGWFDHGLWSSQNRAREEAEAEHARVCTVTGSDGSDIAWAMCRLAMNTAADTCILAMQDVLGLDNGARMNSPGRLGGNWVWRLRDGQWTDELADKVGELTRATGRWPEEPEEEGNGAESPGGGASGPDDGGRA